MRLDRSRLALLAAFLLWSCSHTTPPPLRGVESAAPAIRLDALETRTPIEGLTDCPDKLLRGRSVERFVDDNGKEFDLGVIELSDDGHVSDFEQEEQVFRRLHDFAVEGKGAVIVTFVHGWHHGGKVCDNNMACFRRVLQALSQSGDPRPVFGVYIGWRGESLHGNASVLTFYDRKRTAHLVGHEGGRQVLLKLHALYRALNETIHNEKTAHPVTMVTAGHSFGGALVFSAVEGALVGEVRNVGEGAKGSTDAVGKRTAKCGIRPIRSGIGDLVVLVNPAFEARRYERFAEDLTTPGKYSANQLPVLLTIASEGDSAVKVAFPAGRILYFSALPWRYRGLSDIIGAGHYDPQTTHDLVVEDDSGKEIHPGPLQARTPPEADQATEARCGLNVQGLHDYATCACEYPVPANLAAAINPPAGAPKMALSGGAVNTRPGERVALKTRRDNWDPHAPFIVARAAPDIISQHSDIYTPRFVTFLTAYISEFLKAARNIDPNADDDPCRAGP